MIIHLLVKVSENGAKREQIEIQEQTKSRSSVQHIQDNFPYMASFNLTSVSSHMKVVSGSDRLQ